MISTPSKWTSPGWWFGTWTVMNFIFRYIGNLIIPTDEVIFFRATSSPTLGWFWRRVTTRQSLFSHSVQQTPSRSHQRQYDGVGFPNQPSAGRSTAGPLVVEPGAFGCGAFGCGAFPADRLCRRVWQTFRSCRSHGNPLGDPPQRSDSSSWPNRHDRRIPCGPLPSMALSKNALENSTESWRWTVHSSPRDELWGNFCTRRIQSKTWLAIFMVQGGAPPQL